MKPVLAGVLLAVGMAAGIALAPWMERRASAQDTAAPPLSAQEQATIALFERAQRSTVFISTTQRAMGMFQRGMDMPSGTGSGFVWDDQGHIVTNAHVVRGASGATVRLPGGRAVPARLVGMAPRHDLAVLQVADMAMAPLPLGVSEGLRVGQNVFAIGNPFGLDFTLTTGIVSALDRDLPVEAGLTIRGLIQTDAAINPGNSGGPLLNSAGQVIGVNTAIFSPSGASAGIGFAVPVDTVARVVPQLIRTGRYAPPSLGILADPRADALLRANGAAPGVVILGVEPGSPAQEAGLRPARETLRGLLLGDVIEAIDGEPVRGLGDLQAVLDARAAGDDVTVTLRRGEDRREVRLPLAPGG